MTFRHLEAFVETARLGSVTRAAKLLHLTQPTVSQQLRELEEELGVELFNRVGRGIEVSEAGELLLPHARNLLDDRTLLTEEASRYLGLNAGTLVVHASNIPGEHFLPGMLGEFKQNFPALDLSIMVGDSTDVIELVAAQGALLGVVGRTDPNPDLSFEKLWKDEIALYARPGLASGREIAREELYAIPLVVREAGSASHRVAEGWLSKSGVETARLKIVAKINSTSGIREALLAGLGASFMSAVSVRREVETGALERVRIKGVKPVIRHIYLVTNVKRTLSPAARAFREFLVAAR